MTPWPGRQRLRWLCLACLLPLFFFLSSWWALPAWLLLCWVPLPAPPELLWLSESGELRLSAGDSQYRGRASPALLTPRLVMLRLHKRWYWLFEPELSASDWRRLHRCLRSRP
ncbi:hypothetical protein [Gallaecimonas sp. GXIMD4217]|uniref:hypothetical protein n=1 Tax=Gallaecimonas sp. GXIMD4217 TaxID=3131927 RepID=UPI00311AFB01